MTKKVPTKKRSTAAKSKADSPRVQYDGEVTAEALYKKYVLDPRRHFASNEILHAILYAKESRERDERKVILLGPEDIGLDNAGKDLADRLEVKTYVLKRNADEAARKRWLDELKGATGGFVAVCYTRQHVPADLRREARLYEVNLDDEDLRKEICRSMMRFGEEILRAEGVAFIYDEVKSIVGPVLPGLTPFMTILASHIMRKRIEAASDGANVNPRSSPSAPGPIVPFPPPATTLAPIVNNETAALLELISKRFEQHVILGKGHSTTLALIVLHFWAFDAAQTSPIPAVTSFGPACGKSTVLELLAKLAPRAMPTVGVTGPTVSELADEGHTLYFDEGDMVWTNELIGLVNAGVKKNGPRVRRTGGKHYSVWCPKVIAKIGKVEPDSLASRCIVFQLYPKLANEACEPLREKHHAELNVLAEHCEKWAADAINRLSGAEPLMPPGFSSRRADKWEPLLAIAEDAGQVWTEKAHIAAQIIEAVEKDFPSIQEQLIVDIKAVLDITRLDSILSSALVGYLRKMTARPWSEWSYANGPRRLAEILRNEFKISPKNVRTPVQGKGYERVQFDELFKHYGQEPQQWWDGW